MFKAFIFGLGVTAIFAFFSSLGVARFEELRAEQVGAKLFEFWFYVNTFTLGVVAVTANRGWKALYQWAKKINYGVSNAYSGAAGGIMGWILGLIMAVAIKGKFSELPIGFYLLLIASAFAIPMMIWNVSISRTGDQWVESLFVPTRIFYTLRTLGIAFILLSMWGLYEFFA